MADIRTRAGACGCQKDLPLIALTAPHVDLQSPAQPLSPHGQWVCAHSGRACTGWRQPAAFCSELISALSPVLARPPAMHTGPRAGLRSPRLSQPEPHSSLCPHTLHMLDRLSRSRRPILPCHLQDQARAQFGWNCEVCWLIVSAPLPRKYSSDSRPVPSRQQPSWAGVPRPLLSVLRLAVAIDMPKSPSKRERERSRPGRLNRAFTDRDRGIEGLPENAGSITSAARDEKPLLASQQERRWQQTPPPLTLYSEVYYNHGKPPQPSPALDRILRIRSCLNSRRLAPQ